jgi:hypothetical protein
MSKAAKKRNSERRRSEKAKRKAANVARFTSLIGTNANKKKKGANKAKSKIPGHPHVSGFCGNVGCRKCFPTLNM